MSLLRIFYLFLGGRTWHNISFSQAPNCMKFNFASFSVIPWLESLSSLSAVMNGSFSQKQTGQIYPQSSFADLEILLLLLRKWWRLLKQRGIIESVKGFIYRAYNWFLKGDFSVERSSPVGCGNTSTPYCLTASITVRITFSWRWNFSLWSQRMLFMNCGSRRLMFRKCHLMKLMLKFWR